MHGYYFTEEVRRVLKSAREQAAGLGHEYVGTEHILLALVASEPSVAFDILRALSVDPDAVRSQVNAVVKQGKGDVPPGRDLPYTSRAKKILELAMVEAREHGHNYVGTEHLLLGLLREGHGIAAQALDHVGVSLERARAEMLRHPKVPADMPRSRRVSGPPFPRTYAVLSGGIVLLGVLHTLATFRLFSALSPQALWFASGGLLMMLAGALNYLNLFYGRGARGLRRTTVATNLILTAFAGTSGVVGGASWGELLVIVGLMGGTTSLSVAFAYLSLTPAPRTAPPAGS